MARAVDRLGGIIATGRPVRVGILLFPDVEVLDFAGPFEVFSVADRVARRDGLVQGGAFDVATVAVGIAMSAPAMGWSSAPLTTRATPRRLTCSWCPAGW